MRQVIVEPHAVEDIKQASAWYDLQVPNLGKEFEHAVLEALTMLGQFPLAFPIIR